MGSITIYGIKNCDTMKKARAWLDSHGVAYHFHDYKSEGIARDKLKGWSDEVGWETLLNRAGTTFRKLPDSDREGLNERKALALMLAQPSMIKRPVLDLGGKLLVGFKPEIYAMKWRRAARLVQLDDVFRRAIMRGTANDVLVDDGPHEDRRCGAGPHSHQVPDLEAALGADGLVGANDVLDAVGAAERQRQALILDVLVVRVLHQGYRIGRPLGRKAGAVQGDDVFVSLGTDRVVEVAIGPL